MDKERKTFQTSDGVDISYVDIGEGTPFLWIHGWGGDAEGQVPFLRVLSGFGLRCLCFDQRGCGQSTSMKDLGVPRSAADAKELLEHLNIDDAVILGYSMGAAVVFSYVEQFGTTHLSKLLIGDMSPKPLNDDQWKLGLYQGWYTREQMDRDLYNMEHDYATFAIWFAEQTIFQHRPDEPREFKVTQEYIDAVYVRARAEGKLELLEHFMVVPESNMLANRLYWDSCDSHDYRPALERIDKPIAIYYADPGSIYQPRTAQWMAEQIPGARLYCLDDCTHMAGGEKPREFIRDILEFIRSGGAADGEG